MALNGKFELVRNEGQLEHLVASGIPEDRAKAMLEGGKNIELSINGNSVSITRSNGQVQSYTLNQETTESGPDGHVFKNTATLNGDQLTIVSSGERGDWKRIYSISGSELTLVTNTSKAGVPDGKRIYRKL